MTPASGWYVLLICPVCTISKIKLVRFNYGGTGPSGKRLKFLGTSSYEIANSNQIQRQADMSNASAMTFFRLNRPESRYVLAFTKAAYLHLSYLPSEAIQLVDTIQGATVSSYSWRIQ